MCHFYDADPSIETMGLWNVIKKGNKEKNKIKLQVASISISKMFCCITLLFHLCQGATRFNSPFKASVLLNALAQGARSSCASWRAFYKKGKIYLGLNLIGHKGQPPPRMRKPWLLLSFPVAFLRSQAFHKLKHWSFLPTRKAKTKGRVARELMGTLKGQAL